MVASIQAHNLSGRIANSVSDAIARPLAFLREALTAIDCCST